MGEKGRCKKHKSQRSKMFSRKIKRRKNISVPYHIKRTSNSMIIDEVWINALRYFFCTFSPASNHVQSDFALERADSRPIWVYTVSGLCEFLLWEGGSYWELAKMFEPAPPYMTSWVEHGHQGTVGPWTHFRPRKQPISLQPTGKIAEWWKCGPKWDYWTEL